MDFENLFTKLVIIIELLMMIAILGFLSSIDNKISNVQDNCIIVNNETYCKE